MQVLNGKDVDLQLDMVSSQEASEHWENSKPKIDGYEAGTVQILKQPSLYLCLALILAFSLMTFSGFPVLFWSASLGLSSFVVLSHFLAERFIFSSNAENKEFTAPYEGIFLLIFGAILPGLSLLAFAAISLSGSFQANLPAALARVLLLLLVPCLNFAVWSCIKKRYLARPRLVGLMNGFALGLSFAWTLICLKCVFFAGSSAYSDLAWPFILLASPFSFITAATLCFDLCRRTERRIGRIASTFGIIGSLLAVLFVFAPIVRPLLIQSAMNEAATGTPDVQVKALQFLRSVVRDDDFRSAQHCGFNSLSLGQLFIAVPDPAVYFKVTGNVYQGDGIGVTSNLNVGENFTNCVVGPKIPGLSLAKSQMQGNLNAATLSGSIDWTLDFRNINNSGEQARAEIAVPVGAVISNVNVWSHGRVYDAAVVARENVARCFAGDQYRSVVVTSGPGRIHLQSVMVPPDGGETKIRLEIRMPLVFKDSRTSIANLPKIVDCNFGQPKRERLHLDSRDSFDAGSFTKISTTDSGDNMLDEVIKSSPAGDAFRSIVVRSSAPIGNIATFASNREVITQQIRSVGSATTKHLFVVIDSSAGLKEFIPEIKSALSEVAPGLNAQIYFYPETNRSEQPERDFVAMTVPQAFGAMVPGAFIGGQENGGLLREALESASEQADSAVLWIHGPQPLEQVAGRSATPDLLNKLHLYDFSIAHGPDASLHSLNLDSLGSMINYKAVQRKSTVTVDLKNLIVSLTKPTIETIIVRGSSKKPSNLPMITDSQASSQLTVLWAYDQVNGLLADGKAEEAQTLATKYHLVTAVTAAGAVEGSQSCYGLISDSGVRGPRYSQSNEVGMFVDYGYDTARDISRMITLASAVVGLLLVIFSVRAQRRKQISKSAMIKMSVFAFILPMLVHLIGTFAINNFGGLGGGM